MIGQFSNVVINRVAPAVTLVAFFFILFAFISPVLLFHTSMALVVIKPSQLFVPDPSRIEGVAIFLGVLGKSIGRSKNQAIFNLSHRILFATQQRSTYQLHSFQCSESQIWFVNNRHKG